MAIHSDSGKRSPAGRTGFRATGPMLLILLALLVVWGLFTLFGGDEEPPAATPAPVAAGATDTVTGG